MDDNHNLKLIEPETSLNYVALSYCWGPKCQNFFMTTTLNLAQHRQSVPKDELPQGLQDAISLAMQLDYRYIWIDQLCIIQDDKADLNGELPRMGVLYACADLVIGIDTVDDCTRSFKMNQALGGSIHFGFRPDGPLYKKIFQSSFQWEDKPISLIRRNIQTDYPSSLPHRPGRTSENIELYIGDGSYSPDSFDRVIVQPAVVRPSTQLPWSSRNNHESAFVKDDPNRQTVYVRDMRLMNHLNKSIQNQWKCLDRRGWTLQECRMASRLLTLGLGEMKWRCAVVDFCECTESSTSMGRANDFVESSPVEYRLQDLMNRQQERKRRDLYSALIKSHSQNSFSQEDIYEAWENLINDFSERQLRDINEKIPALAGVINVFSKALRGPNDDQNVSFAGLWKGNVLRGLLWRSISYFNSPATTFYTRSIGAYAAELRMPNTELLLQHMRLDQIPNNFLLHHAYHTGRPCFANTVYWPIINHYPQPGERQETFPSWSWLSVFGTVKYWNWIYGCPEQLAFQKSNHVEFVADAIVLDAQIYPSLHFQYDVPFGEVKLNCRAAPVRLKSLLHGPRPTRVDFCEAYEAAKFEQDTSTLPFLIPPLLESVTHFACIEGDPALMILLTDSPCLYGGNDGPGQDINSWLIDLMRNEYKFHLEQKTQHVEGSASPGLSVNHDFERFMPCTNSEQPGHTLRFESMCSNAECACKKRWTDPKSYPALAVYIGCARIDGENGRRVVMRFSLILMESVHTKGKYHRIGIAIHDQSTVLAGYRDPFKNAERKDVIII